MRLLAVALALGAGLVWSCAAEKPKPAVQQDEITAARLRSLKEDNSILRYLEPTPEEARALAEESALRGDGVAPADAVDTLAADHELEEPSQREKAEQAGISALAVAVTIGAMVAPYLLF
jgi:hypothetical protein